MSFTQIIRSPQMLVSVIGAAVVALGTAGILTLPQSSAIQALLAAVLGVVAAFTHASVSTKLAARQARQAAEKAVARERTRTRPAPGID